MAEEKKGLFHRFKDGLKKTRKNLSTGVGSLFSGFTQLDDEFYEELEENLILSDMGVRTTDQVIEHLKENVKENKIKTAEDCKTALMDDLKEKMKTEENVYDYEDQTSVILFIGVNGVGKTTSVGKLAARYKKEGKKVLLCAADTFRAGAIDQLKEWSTRAQVDIIAGQEGQDPASVVFDAVVAAKARNVDLLLCDTAGRLHNKKNLMAELGKIHKIIQGEFSEAQMKTFLVVDATTGQNALVQAKEFGEVSEIDGVILTKLDGTAKGGIAVAIQSEQKIPIAFVGIGEQVEDLEKFDSDSFVDALFEVAENEDM